MDNYIIVYKDGQFEEWCSEHKLKNTQPNQVFFICKKDRTIDPPYSYGEHAIFTICNRDGNVVPLNIGDLTLFSFRTKGTMRNFILSWDIGRSGTKEEYSLSRDNVWSLPKNFDDEWEDPIKDTISLIQDIRRFGLNIRQELDSLKRNIYSIDRKIGWGGERYSQLEIYSHFRDIDFEKSGIHLKTYNVQLPYVEKEYKRIANVKSRLNVQEALAFLHDELAKREHALKLLVEGNEILENYAYSLETVFIKDGVETIEDRQFEGCKNAITIVLPPSVTCIVHTAFNFTSIESVYINSPVLVNLIASFPVPGIMLSKAKFYVPSKLVEKYLTSMSWKSLSDRILAINDEGQR